MTNIAWRVYKLFAFRSVWIWYFFGDFWLLSLGFGTAGDLLSVLTLRWNNDSVWLLNNWNNCQLQLLHVVNWIMKHKRRVPVLTKSQIKLIISEGKTQVKVQIQRRSGCSIFILIKGAYKAQYECKKDIKPSQYFWEENLDCWCKQVGSLDSTGGLEKESASVQRTGWWTEHENWAGSGPVQEGKKRGLGLSCLMLQTSHLRPHRPPLGHQSTSARMWISWFYSKIQPHWYQTQVQTDWLSDCNPFVSSIFGFLTRSC